jgi:hypothetical protein
VTPGRLLVRSLCETVETVWIVWTVATVGREWSEIRRTAGKCPAEGS